MCRETDSIENIFEVDMDRVKHAKNIEMDSVAEVDRDKETIRDILSSLGLTVNQWDNKRLRIMPHGGCGDLIESVILEIIERGSVNLKYGPIVQKIRIYSLKDKLQRLFSYSKVVNGPFPAGAQNVYVIVHANDTMNLERTPEGYFRFPSFRGINVLEFLGSAQAWIGNMELIKDIHSSNMFALIRCREKFLNQPLRFLFPGKTFFPQEIRDKYTQIEVSETLGLVENNMTMESTVFFKDLINTILSPGMQSHPNFTPHPSLAHPPLLAYPPLLAHTPIISAPPSKKIILVILGPRPVQNIWMEKKDDGGKTFHGFPIFEDITTAEFERLIVRPNIDVDGVDRIDLGPVMVYICSCHNESQFFNMKTEAEKHYDRRLRHNLQDESFSRIYSIAMNNYDSIGRGTGDIIRTYIKSDGTVRPHD